MHISAYDPHALRAWGVVFLLLIAIHPGKAAPVQAAAAAKPASGTAGAAVPQQPGASKPAVSPTLRVAPQAATATPSVPATPSMESAAEEGEEVEEVEEEETVEAPSALKGSALARQASSIQKQIGRTRGSGTFFISSWFTDAPPASSFAPASTLAANAPEDCEPLDAAIAEAYIRDSAKREGVSSDLIREVVRKESGFRPCAVSPKGAMGMMQLTAATAASLGIDDPYDPRQNIDGGVRLMKRLLEKYKGRPDLALAAYNAGEGAVNAHQGVPAYDETQEYVSTIMKRVFEEPSRASGLAPRVPAKIPPIPPVNVPSAKAVEGN
ncbi:MAG: lytic transglycosylase domain-containing protein [Bryobacterales bacterium]|nr:lytic transglycosylase domain-containing protein [Bryobacterales bacterium]